MKYSLFFLFLISLSSVYFVSATIPIVDLNTQSTMASIPKVSISIPTSGSSVNNNTLNVNNSQYLQGKTPSNFWQVGVTQSVGSDIKRGNIFLQDSSNINSLSVLTRFLSDFSGTAAIYYGSRILYSNLNDAGVASQDWQNRLLYGVNGVNPNLDYYNDSGINIFNSLGINTVEHFLDTQVYIKGVPYVNACQGSITSCSDVTDLDACGYFGGCSPSFCAGTKSCPSDETQCKNINSNVADVCVPNYDCGSNTINYCNQITEETACNNLGCDWNSGSNLCDYYDGSYDCSNYDYMNCGSGNPCYWDSSNSICTYYIGASCSSLSYPNCYQAQPCSDTYLSCNSGSLDCSYIGNSINCNYAGCTYSVYDSCGNINGGLNNPDCSQLTGSRYCSSSGTNGYCIDNSSTDFRNLVVQAGISQTNDTFQCLEAGGTKQLYLDNGCELHNNVGSTFGGQSIFNGQTYFNAYAQFNSPSGVVFYYPITTVNSQPLYDGVYSIGSGGGRYNRSYINNMYSNNIYTTNVSATLINSTNIISRNISVINLNATNTTTSTLQVNGDSKMIGNLNITQNLMIVGNLSVKVPYATFTDNTTQGMASTSVGQVMNFSKTEDNYNINIVGKQNITVKQTGDYHFIVSAIGICANNNKHINVWWQKNGVNVPRSNTLQELSTANVEALMTIPFIMDLNSTDNLRIMWNADSTGCSLAYTTNTSFIPETPSIILTINRIGDDA